jgi:hypothetical protein
LIGPLSQLSQIPDNSTPNLTASHGPVANRSWPLTPKLTSVLAAFAIVPGTGSAFAYATWIAPQDGVYALVQGEGSAKHEAYDPMIVSAPRGMDAAGADMAVSFVATQSAVSLAGTDGAAVLTAVYAEGWLTEYAAGEWHHAKADAFPDFKGMGQHFTYPVAYLAGLHMAEKEVLGQHVVLSFVAQGPAGE